MCLRPQSELHGFITARTSGLEMCGSLSAASCCSGKEQGREDMWHPQPVCYVLTLTCRWICLDLRLGSSEALIAGSWLILNTWPLCTGAKLNLRESLSGVEKNK